MSTAHLLADQVTYQMAGDSPFAAIVPDFTVLGIKVDALWKKAVAGLLALTLVVTGASLLIGIGSLRKARANINSGQEDEAKHKILWSSIAFLGTILFPAITVAIFAAVG